jgi:hypothetical protein
LSFKLLGFCVLLDNKGGEVHVRGHQIDDAPHAASERIEAREFSVNEAFGKQDQPLFRSYLFWGFVSCF